MVFVKSIGTGIQGVGVGHHLDSTEVGFTCHIVLVVLPVIVFGRLLTSHKCLMYSPPLV